MPGPACVRPPVPPITCPTVSASLRLICNRLEAPVTVTLPPPSVPVVPPFPTSSVPPVIVVVPAYVLAPVSVATPVPSFVRVPVPLMSWPRATVPVRLICSVPSFTTERPLPNVPVAPPAPTDRVRPAAIVVGPVNVLAPVNEIVPAPACVRLPVPPIALAIVRAALRLKIRAPAFVTAPEPRCRSPPPLVACRWRSSSRPCTCWCRSG